MAALDQVLALPGGTRGIVTNDICNGGRTVVNISTSGKVVAPSALPLVDGHITVQFERIQEAHELNVGLRSKARS